MENALEKSGHTSLQPVFEDMADGKCFTLDRDTDEKESRLWIDDLDHAQLLRQDFCPPVSGLGLIHPAHSLHCCLVQAHRARHNHQVTALNITARVPTTTPCPFRLYDFTTPTPWHAHGSAPNGAPRGPTLAFSWGPKSGTCINGTRKSRCTSSKQSAASTLSLLLYIL